ncbi:hypothetical protein LSAT2_002952 [Lamellibrachia satsuma]|nr:hypothetical protein LSAT2_002952 [Lamellibrachia satsuma]
MNSKITIIILVTMGMICFADAWFLVPEPEVTCARECEKNFKECLALCDARKFQGIDRSRCRDGVCRTKRTLCRKAC